MTEDEIRKRAEDLYKEIFPQYPTLATCENCKANNCIYNKTCCKCGSPILEVYHAIVKILKANSFEQHLYGDMIRVTTGCVFSYECLISYKAVLDFQMDWGYA